MNIKSPILTSGHSVAHNPVEELFKELTDTLPIGIYIVQKGKFVFANRQFLDNMGFTEDELIGTVSLDYVEPDDRENVREETIKRLKGELSTPYEFRIITKSGKTRVVLETMTSIQCQGDRAALGSHIDITERRIIEKALQESRAGFYNIVERSADGIIVTNHDGIVLFANRTLGSILKCRPEKLVGEMFGFPLTSGESTEIDIICKSGEPGTGEIWVVDTEWDGQPAYLASIRDITERKKMEEALIKYDHTRSEFLSNVSHELRNPLQPIKGLTKLILDGRVPDAETQQEFLTIVESESRRLGTLVDNLLDMSRLEHGRFTIVKKRVPIRDTILDVSGNFKGLAITREMTITEDIPSTLPEMEVDNERIRQVIANLLSNAIKFSNPGGKVTVKAEVRDGELLVQVADQGMGVSEEAMPHLFERFYRAGDTAWTGGAGLGLHVSKQIVEAHNGNMRVESKSGEGSIFSFTLPIDDFGGN